VTVFTKADTNRLIYSATRERNTHYLFRFPAKFHPPVARALLDRYVDGDDKTVWDPFVGSGTLLVEAAVAGRSAIGSDVDPLAIFVSRVKSRPLPAEDVNRAWKRLDARLSRWDRGEAWYVGFDPRTEDIAWRDPEERLPAIPNIAHWFRPYVAVDLARIKREIHSIPDRSVREFFLLILGSIIRASSNADPVPVSGLEVTSHMRRLEAAGRTVDPFRLYSATARRAIADMAQFERALDTPPKPIRTFRADATRPQARRLPEGVSAIITSPPYHGAVDYYRRHQLEMFWLDLTASQDDRLRLLDQYIGRPKVPQRNRFVRSTMPLTPWIRSLEQEMRAVDPPRADAFKHYCNSMRRSFRQFAAVLPRGAPAVFVVGHSAWNGEVLSTSNLFAELAAPEFEMDETLWYPVSNRYMSYKRHNGASIDTEYVVVLRRC
jgi:tRNA G10  N-methylase Trm11